MRLALAVVLSFGALLLTPPAYASWQSNQVLVNGDTIQFSFRWGWAERPVQGDFTVTVDNTITNKIGGNGEVLDTYRIIFGGQVIENSEKGVFTYNFTATESQTIRFEGIDNGFWGGFYGPIVTLTQAPMEIVLEPVTASPTVSEEVSVSEEVTVSDDVSVSDQVSESQEVTQSEEVPQPEEVPQSVIEPPVTELVPEQTESAEPTESPIVTESPTLSPNPVTESPTTSPAVSESAPIQSTESATATQSQPTPQVELPQPTPGQIPEPVIPVVTEPSQPPLEPTSSESVALDETSPVFTFVGEALADLVGAVTSAGLDMTPEQREEAQELIVSSVIVSQVAGAATAAVRKK